MRLRPRVPAGRYEWRDPNNVYVLVGQYQFCTTANIYIERKSGIQSGHTYAFDGIKLQGVATPAGMRLRGALGVLVRSAYSEMSGNQGISSASWAGGTVTITTTGNHSFQEGQNVGISGITPSGYNGLFAIHVSGTNTFTYSLAANPGTATTTNAAASQPDQSVILVTKASGGSNTNVDDWAHFIGVVDSTMQDFGGPPAPLYTTGVAKHFDVDNCHRFYSRNNHHHGPLTMISRDNPVCHLRGNTSGCEVDFESVAQFGALGTKESDLLQIILNEGTGNYGQWWDPTSFRYEYR